MEEVRVVKLSKNTEYVVFDIDNNLIVDKVKVGDYLSTRDDYKYCLESEDNKRVFRITEKYSFIKRFKSLNRINKRGVISAIFDIGYMCKLWKAQFIRVKYL